MHQDQWAISPNMYVPVSDNINNHPPSPLITRGITLKLQNRAIDSKNAYDDSVADVIGVIQAQRDNADVKHGEWYKMAETLAKDLNVPVGKPRTTVRQKNRNNVPAETTEVYYRRGDQ